MPDTSKRRELAQSYKERRASGGVFRFVHSASGWTSPPRASQNLEGEKNKLRLYKTSGTPSDIELLKVWSQFGGDGFGIEVLDELEQKPDQSAEEFKNDLNELLKLRQ